ncbi:hypothetical protein ACOMHN_058468 [Nucella lapillus]
MTPATFQLSHGDPFVVSTELWRETTEGTRQQLEVLHISEKEPSLGKTEAMFQPLLSRAASAPPPPVVINNTEIKAADMFCCLGSTVSSTRYLDAEVVLGMLDLWQTQRRCGKTMASNYTRRSPCSVVRLGPGILQPPGWYTGLAFGAGQDLWSRLDVPHNHFTFISTIAPVVPRIDCSQVQIGGSLGLHIWTGERDGERKVLVKKNSRVSSPFRVDGGVIRVRVCCGLRSLSGCDVAGPQLRLTFHQTIPSSSHDLGGRGVVVPLVLNKTRPYRHPVMTWGGRGVVVPLVLNKTRPYRHPVMTWGGEGCCGAIGAEQDQTIPSSSHDLGGEGCCGAIGAEQDQTIPSSSHDLGGRGVVVPLVLNKTIPYRHPVMTWGGGVLWCHWC